MTLLLAGGGIDGRGAVPGGEVAAVSETGDVTDVAEEAGGAGQADAIEVLQAAAGGSDQLGQLDVGGLDLLIDGGELADQLAGQLAAGPPGNVTRPHGCHQGAGLPGGQELLRAPGQ